MPPERRAARYTLVAIILHWTMALGFAALAVLGLVMTHMSLGPQRLFQLYQLHKSIGLTMLLAAALRLAWRLAHSPPAWPPAMSKAEQAAAAGTHWLLYGLLLTLPFTGWALVSASVFNIPTVLYGVIPWPSLPILSTLPDKAPVEALLKRVHAYGAWFLICLVALHLAATLRHQFIRRDDVLLRMLPGRLMAERARAEGRSP